MATRPICFTVVISILQVLTDLEEGYEDLPRGRVVESSVIDTEFSVPRVASLHVEDVIHVTAIVCLDDKDHGVDAPLATIVLGSDNY